MSNNVKFSEFDLRDKNSSNNIAHYIVGYDASLNANFRLPIVEIFKSLGGITNYESSFTNISSITVNHNLNKIPYVEIYDTSGDVLVGQITHDHVNKDRFEVNFNSPLSGKIIYA